MTVWEFKNASQNDVASLVYANESDIGARTFDARGLPLHWSTPPQVSVFVEPRKKTAKPRVDISALRPGAMVLNAKAMGTLRDFLAQFGQLLEIDVEGATEWFYNVTNVVDCIDEERSVKRSTGVIAKEAFLHDRVPQAPAIFKDPRTARTRIYANDVAKDLIEQLIARAAITGVEFTEPGPPPPKPRPRSKD